MADNDSKMIIKAKMLYRKYSYKLQYLGNQPISVRGGAEYIKQILSTSEPFMLCRIGAEECRTVVKWMKNKPYEPRNYHNIMFNAGVFPNDKQTIDRFCKIYSDALTNADGVFTWGCVGEGALIRKFAPQNVTLMRNATNNILFYDEVWTTSLEGKKVLIVHPFTETIASQYKRREHLFKTAKLPTFGSIDYVKAIQSNAGEDQNTGYDSWVDALQAMKEEIESKDFEVALIAAGAYGLPLAAHIKQMGKQAIHMASNMQILFGVRGKRWDNWADWTPYFNEYWVYPSEDETPKGKSTVEGGSYWK